MAAYRDMAGTGRYPPMPFHAPITFYTTIRNSDPEMLAKIMAMDPYCITQDNGAGAPVHFATTYKQLDMLHHLLNQGAEVNQQDSRGLTPLHRAAHLAHLDGYMEIYEYLLSRGGDPSIAALKYDEYLAPGPKYPCDIAMPEVVDALKALEIRYAAVTKARRPNPYIGDWWTLYDYGLDMIKSWAYDYKPDFPEVRRKKRDDQAAADARAARHARKEAFLTALSQGGSEAARAVLISATAPAGAKGTPAGPSKPKTIKAVASKPVATPATPFTAFLFPGQGSQAVGMLQQSSELPDVKEMLAVAQQVLGYDLLALCTQGPQEALDSTVVAQPALLVAGLAAARRCFHEDPTGYASCNAAAGLSLGEYSALVWAGAMSLEDGLKVVKVRAEAMNAAAQQGEPHGMLSVVGLPDADLNQLCQRVLTEVSVPGGTVCQITNYLFPQGRVVSGHIAALDVLKALATSQGALKATMLQVSGAFHTRLMEPARNALAAALADVTITAPRVPVISNITAEPFPSDPDEIRALLARQLVEPVQWESTLRWMLSKGQSGAGGCSQLYELGPGQQIKAMVRRLDGTAWKAFKNIQA